MIKSRCFGEVLLRKDIVKKKTSRNLQISDLVAETAIFVKFALSKIKVIARATLPLPTACPLVSLFKLLEMLHIIPILLPPTGLVHFSIIT